MFPITLSFLKSYNLFQERHMAKGKTVAGLTYFGLEFKAVTLTTMGNLMFSLNPKKHIQ